MNKTIQYFINNPRRLFLLDSIGALYTAILLYVVLGNFYDLFGMPVHILTYLSSIASAYCIYSATCFLLLKNNWGRFIRIIGIANLLYCVVTNAFVVIHFSELTKWGVLYFILETAIISTLVYVEFKVAKAVGN